MTAALDIRSDPFANLFGARRGGGASHLLLPENITDPGSFAEALAALRDDRRLAASKEGAAAVERLARYLGDHYLTAGMWSRQVHSMYRMLAKRHDPSTDGVPDVEALVSQRAHRAIYSAVDDVSMPLPDHPLTSLTADITDSFASKLALRVSANRPVIEDSSLARLLPEGALDDLKASYPTALRYREIHVEADPQLQPLLREWRTPMRVALNSDTEESARAVLHAAAELALAGT